MGSCLSCDTCVPWWCPACQEEVCSWFETDAGRHKRCGQPKPTPCPERLELGKAYSATLWPEIRDEETRTAARQALRAHEQTCAKCVAESPPRAALAAVGRE